MNSVIIIISVYFRTEVLSSVLIGLKVHTDTVYRQDDIVVVKSHTQVRITLYGTDINRCKDVLLTQVKLEDGSQCFINMTTKTTIHVRNDQPNHKVLDLVVQNDGTMFFCLLCNGQWIHQGSNELKSLVVQKTLFTIPTWSYVIIVIVLFILSSLFSGLNLSLMIFQPSTLKLIKMAGTPREKMFAERIYPVRKLGNILLCSILLSNVITNSSITIIIEKLTKNAILTLFVSTFGIVIVGEILPQAFGARYALEISAHTIYLTIFCLVITFLLAYPVGKLLNIILGDEIRQYYSKEKLKLLIKEQEKLGFVIKDEMEIISGALGLTEKTVADVMTPISHAYMLNYNSNLDYTTMKEIVRNGYTRIPVYDNDKNNIKGILNIKDLTFIDPYDNIPVSTVCSFYNREVLVVPHTTRLTELLDEFKKGKAHLAFVEKLISGPDIDPYQVLIGLITLEDVIEEIIQDEIVDETDIFSDNTFRRKLLNHTSRSENLTDSVEMFRLSPQLNEAVYHYMATKISSFNELYVKDRVLRSFLSSKILLNHVHRFDKPLDNQLIKDGQPMFCVILIIQGKVSVQISSENLSFEGGPFMLFGESVLINANKFMKTGIVNRKMIFNSKSIYTHSKSISDYTVTSLTDLQYVRISAAQYLFARHLSYNLAIKDFDTFNSEKYYEDWNDLGDVCKSGE